MACFWYSTCSFSKYFHWLKFIISSNHNSSNSITSTRSHKFVRTKNNEWSRKMAETNDALTFHSCAARWPGNVQLYPVLRSEQPTGRTGMILQYLVVFYHGEEAGMSVRIPSSHFMRPRRRYIHCFVLLKREENYPRCDPLRCAVVRVSSFGFVLKTEMKFAVLTKIASFQLRRPGRWCDYFSFEFTFLQNFSWFPQLRWRTRIFFPPLSSFISWIIACAFKSRRWWIYLSARSMQPAFCCTCSVPSAPVWARSLVFAPPTLDSAQTLTHTPSPSHAGACNLPVILNSRPFVKCGICEVHGGCFSSGISVSYFFVNVVLKWTVHNQLTTFVFVGFIVITYSTWRPGLRQRVIFHRA